MLIDKRDNEEMDNHELFDYNCFYDLSILKNALNLALESPFAFTNHDNREVLDIILKQIKIQYTVKSSKELSSKLF